MNEWMFATFFPGEIGAAIALWRDWRAVSAPGLGLAIPGLPGPQQPDIGDKLWLMYWDIHPKHPFQLIGCGMLQRSPSNGLVWRDGDLPGIEAAARALGYDDVSGVLRFFRVESAQDFWREPRKYHGMFSHFGLIQLSSSQRELLGRLSQGEEEVRDAEQPMLLLPARPIAPLKRSESLVRYAKHWAYAGKGVKAQTPLGEFLLDIIHGFQHSGAIPPLNILNELLATGGSSGGMGPGTKWKPFSISQPEYETAVQYLLNLDCAAAKEAHPYLYAKKFFVDEDLNRDVEDWLDFLGKSSRKYPYAR